MNNTFEESDAFKFLSKLADECGNNSYLHYILEIQIIKYRREELEEKRNQ